ncbi:hypothetical protein [Herbaspirillum robiniae]|uniref:hypothetical protein n=1 Tax=Herbaspirillum robiniae TaxID=2014887 RepID=UPI0009A1ED22|nr:hypothetical protein [Herbaspirillum robiniae]
MPDFIKQDNLKQVLEAISGLVGKDVLVGIPDSAPERRTDESGEPTPPSNAVIGYIQETGSPANNIPPRPFLVPGVAEVQDAISTRLGKAASAALAGDKDGAEVQMGRAGLQAQNSVRARINNGVMPELKDSTIANRLRRGRTGTVPLIDTGQLRNSIIYVIRKKA